MTTLLALDIDGVLKPSSPHFGGKPVFLHAPYQGNFAVSMNLLTRLQADPAVELWWLTTWLSEAIDTFGRVLPARGYLDAKEGQGWWKYDALTTFLGTRPDIDTVIWIDDDLSRYDDLPPLREDWRTYAPHPLVGITPAGLDSVGL